MVSSQKEDSPENTETMCNQSPPSRGGQVHKKKIRQRILKHEWVEGQGWVRRVHKKKIRQRILKLIFMDSMSDLFGRSQKEDSPENTETGLHADAPQNLYRSQKEDSPENTETNLAYNESDGQRRSQKEDSPENTETSQ